MIIIDKKNLKHEHLNGIYEEMAGIIGVDMVFDLYMHYRGQQISFPSKLFSKQFVQSCIMKEFDGKNFADLAVKYGYSERWIREIVRKNLKKNLQKKARISQCQAKSK